MAMGVSALVAAGAQADIEVFNSATPAENAAFRAAWLLAMDVDTPQHLVDFESGFVEDQNVSGVGGLFPGGLVILDSSPSGNAYIESGSIGGSNAIGTFAVAHNESPYLELIFSTPVDYVGLYDIDQAGSTVVVTFTDETTTDFSIETTGAGGDSAEFFGIWRGDCPAIIRVQIDASGDGEWGIDNIEYGVGSGCEADCNGDGTLNILDFVCFQGLFTAGDLEADCNGDGVLNILDFVCFQGAFQDGC
jgi:hypothetical protein